MNPVIFLDIDGPMVTKRSAETWCDRLLCLSFDSEAVTILNEAIIQTSAEIVVSSTWRIGRTLNKLNAILEGFGVPKAIDVTPVLKHGTRGMEIQTWLLFHKDVERFAVIDDDSDISPFQDRWINTPFDTGLNRSHLADLVRILNG